MTPLLPAEELESINPKAIYQKEPRLTLSHRRRVFPNTALTCATGTSRTARADISSAQSRCRALASAPPGCTSQCHVFLQGWSRSQAGIPRSAHHTGIPPMLQTALLCVLGTPDVWKSRSLGSLGLLGACLRFSFRASPWCT